MPDAPKRSCRRCRGLHGRGDVCPVVAAAERERQAVKNHFFNTPEWKQLRARKLHADPWCECEHCEACGVFVRATDVDHVISREERPDLELAFSNLASLAHGHHSRKTVARDGGFGRPRGAFNR